jgi:hypothetical protein
MHLPIYLSIKDVQKALAVSERTAKRRLAVLKDAMQLPKYQKVTVVAFCMYYDVDIDIFYKNVSSSARSAKAGQRVLA